MSAEPGVMVARDQKALLGTRVLRDLHVKVLPKWRRSDASLKRLGYVP